MIRRRTASSLDSASPTAALVRPTTGEQLADRLMEEILQGHIERGTGLRQEMLAAQYSVSRRTVRDALQHLERNGLVRHFRHRGTFVRDFDPADVRELYQARGVLERSAAARMGRATMPVGAGANLDRAMKRLEGAVDLGEALGIVRADLDFHAAVVGLLDNSRVNAFFSTIATEMLYAIALLEVTDSESTIRPREALGEHQAIYEALASGEGSRAAALVDVHIIENCARIVQIVEH